MNLHYEFKTNYNKQENCVLMPINSKQQVDIH